VGLAGRILAQHEPAPKRAGIGRNRYRSAYEFGVKAAIIKLVSDKKPSQNHHGLALRPKMARHSQWRPSVCFDRRRRLPLRATQIGYEAKYFAP
jgi:hypothetical protein